MNYYNEFDPKAAAWLRELIKQKLIPNGIVDERSITEIKPNELTEYTQCHFFAGIGGWSLGLQLAGWPEDRSVWTGSCPCQPFSSAGKKLAQADERHLWPVFFNLIRQCRPDVVFGEQVASAIGKGWLDGVSADMESENYACGAAVLGAHSVGAPHIRQRLYWVADSESCRFAESQQFRSVSEEKNGERPSDTSRNNSNFSIWDSFDVLLCTDGKQRRVESGTFPLAHGVSERVGLLRGYGNAIVPQVAKAFIESFIEARTLKPE
jgi:DNA (cytosine-5)-methyltransferase 1